MDALTFPGRRVMLTKPDRFRLPRTVLDVLQPVVLYTSALASPNRFRQAVQAGGSPMRSGYCRLTRAHAGDHEASAAGMSACRHETVSAVDLPVD